MRTTVTIRDDLLVQAKALALSSNRTLGSVVEDALTELLARQAATKAQARVVIPTSGDPRRPPLVDILDKEALARALGDDVGLLRGGDAA